MSSVLSFLQSEHVLALLITISIFFITIFLTVKRWIGFSMTFLFLLFALTAGMLVNFQQNIQNYFTSSSNLPIPNEPPSEDFHKQMMQAMENLKVELSTEKEYLLRVMNQVQEIFDSMDMQKQKLQIFIEEVRKQFNIHSVSPTSTLSDTSEQIQETQTK
jgi:hypothetical protein